MLYIVTVSEKTYGTERKVAELCVCTETDPSTPLLVLPGGFSQV